MLLDVALYAVIAACSAFAFASMCADVVVYAALGFVALAFACAAYICLVRALEHWLD